MMDDGWMKERKMRGWRDGRRMDNRWMKVDDGWKRDS